MEEYNISLIEEIITALSNVEFEQNCMIDYVGLSFDAYTKIKREVEDSLDRPVTVTDVNSALTISHFIISGLPGIDYKFLKEVSFV